MEKGFGKVVLVSVVVSVITSLVMFFAIQQVMLGPLASNYQAVPALSGQVRANSCNADGVCEANSVTVSGTLTANDIVCESCEPVLLRFIINSDVGGNTVTIMDAMTSQTICQNKRPGEECNYKDYILNVRNISAGSYIESVDMALVSGNGVLLPASQHMTVTDDSGSVFYGTDDLRLLIQPM